MVSERSARVQFTVDPAGRSVNQKQSLRVEGPGAGQSKCDDEAPIVVWKNRGWPRSWPDNYCPIIRPTVERNDNGARWRETQLQQHEHETGRGDRQDERSSRPTARRSLSGRIVRLREWGSVSLFLVGVNVAGYIRWGEEMYSDLSG